MTNSSTDTKELVELKTPDMYNIIIHNDNTTPIDLVIFILVECVELDSTTAFAKAQEAHYSGSSVAATYTKEKAQEIINISRDTAAMNGHPDFTLTMEKD